MASGIGTLRGPALAAILAVTAAPAAAADEAPARPTEEMGADLQAYGACLRAYFPSDVERVLEPLGWTVVEALSAEERKILAGAILPLLIRDPGADFSLESVWKDSLQIARNVDGQLESAFSLGFVRRDLGTVLAVLPARLEAKNGVDCVYAGPLTEGPGGLAAVLARAAGNPAANATHQGIPELHIWDETLGYPHNGATYEVTARYGRYLAPVIPSIVPENHPQLGLELVVLH